MSSLSAPEFLARGRLCIWPAVDRVCCSSMRMVRGTLAPAPAANRGLSGWDTALTSCIRDGRCVSLVQWKELFAETASSPALFHETGVLWLASENDVGFNEMTAVLTRCKVPFESLSSSAIAQRYPQFIRTAWTPEFWRPRAEY